MSVERTVVEQTENFGDPDLLLAQDWFLFKRDANRDLPVWLCLSTG